MSTDAKAETRAARQPWGDRWLVDAFRQLGNPLADSLTSATSAWDALEGAGVPTADIIRVVSDMTGAKAVDVSTLGPGQSDLLSAALSARYDVVPIRLDGRAMEVATANPLGGNLERDLAFASGKRIRVGIARPEDIRQARQRIYEGESMPVALGPRLAWVAVASPLAPAAAPTRGVAVDTLDRIVIDAVDQRASDIHLEPQDGELLVRYRVDGILHDVMRVSSDLTPLLLSRLKVSAGLDIANRIRPQDGRASISIDGRAIDLRVSTLPLGERVEKAVVRILDASLSTLDLETLGFNEADCISLRRILSANEGVVLVTGPTGSGKTTTLYAALLQVRSHETNIVTVEDPIEYRLEGVNQVQVNEKGGLTFAAALRSILRQDPDVVLVGEIRDAETASIALRAGMTGHLVLSTLHTNDATSAISRLADIGVDLTTVAGSLRAVIAQRLVRRLCSECSVPATLAELPTDHLWLLEKLDTSLLRRPVGCTACRGTGYRGRMAIAEILMIDEEAQQLMARTAKRFEFLQLARKHGMHTLWETGLERVLQGLTAFQELLANLTPPVPDGDLQQEDVDRLLADLVGGVTAKPADLTLDMIEPPTSIVVREREPLRSITASGGSAMALTPRVIAPRVATSDGAPRVLLVHDIRPRRTLIRRALERAGCTVIEAADGEAALAYACRLRPDALVTEIAIPKLDGIGLLQTILSERIIDHVFVYTDQRDSGLIDWMRELGATDVLTTRDDVETLATRVRIEFPGTLNPVALRVS